MRGSIRSSETAVSESLGFILVSGILLISFAIIFAIGYPMYNGYIDGGHMNNVQQSFRILANNANNIALQKSPFSTSEIKMYDGTLTTREAGYMNISYIDASNGKLYFNNTSLTMLEYSKGSEKVAYIEGSVCRLGPSGSIMMKDPEIYNNTDTMIIPLVTLSDSNLTVAGNGPVQLSFLTPYFSKMAKTVASPSMAHFRVSRIDITVSSEYSHAFSDYLQRQGYSVSSETNGKVSLYKTSLIDIYIMQCYLTIQAK